MEIYNILIKEYDDEYIVECYICEYSFQSYEEAEQYLKSKGYEWIGEEKYQREWHGSDYVAEICKCSIR